MPRFRVPSLTVRNPSLVSAIRELVARDESLDGLLVSRGFYDQDGAFVLQGAMDHPGQTDRLRDQFDRLVAERGWRDRLPQGWRLGSFATVPIRPMLDYLAFVMPSDTTFDGIALRRAYYDPRGELVLSGTTTGSPAPNILASQFTDLLKARPDLDVRRALPDASRPLHVALKPIPADESILEPSLSRALQDIAAGSYISAIEILDGAIRNSPRDSTAWYLRAGCFLSLGDRARAERDIRRMMAQERFSSIPYRTRHQRLERLQGQFRIALEAFQAEIAALPESRP
jgi:hypothetical protein